MLLWETESVTYRPMLRGVERAQKNASPLGLAFFKKQSKKSTLAELGSAAGSLEAVLAYSLAPVFLDFMGFLASALKCCPSI